MGLGDRLQHAWNAFRNNRDPTYGFTDMGASSFHRPDRHRYTRGNERSMMTSLYNRMAMDAAATEIKHVQLDENGRFTDEIDSGLNTCLTLEANIDQTARAFRQDIFASLLDEGCIAVVPVETSLNPKDTGAYDILSMRVGKIVEWKPTMVRVSLYNERLGRHDELWMMKKNVAIIENPLYSVTNEPNSTLQRLKRKLAILDAVDDQIGAGKLDMIIQLPYVVKSKARQDQANARRADLEHQLESSKLGVAYIDGTERITQLNRPLENNLLKQVEFLTNQLYSLLGMTQTILDGTADEKTMLNYYDRSIEPLVSAVVDEFKRKFLTKTARSQGKSIVCFRSMFKLVPASELAKIADTFTRNEILTSNEIRQIIGVKPSTDPRADQLVNSNLNNPTILPQDEYDDAQYYEEGDVDQNGE